MKLIEEALVGTLFVASLVVGGLWFASDAQIRDWPLPFSNAGGNSTTRMPNVSVKQLDWSADGQELFSFSRGEPDNLGSLALHALALESTSRVLLNVREHIGATALAPNGRNVLVATYTGELRWVDLESFETITLVEPCHFQCRTSLVAAAVANDGSLVAAGSCHGLIYVCDPARRTLCILGGSRETSTPWLQLSSEDAVVMLKGVQAERQSSVADLHFSPDGKRLLSTQNNGCVCLWNLGTGKLLQEFTGHQGPATAAVILRDGQRIMSAGLDDTIRIWDIASGRELWRGEFGLGGVNVVAVSPDGKTAAWGGHSYKIVVWDLERACKKFELTTPASVVFDLKFSPDGALLAAAGMESIIHLYDMQTAAERKGLQAAVSRDR